VNPRTVKSPNILVSNPEEHHEGDWNMLVINSMRSTRYTNFHFVAHVMQIKLRFCGTVMEHMKFINKRIKFKNSFNTAKENTGGEG
jgi:hypothetical protein